MRLILAEYFTHDVADLTQRCIGLDCSQDIRHEVRIIILASFLEVSQGSFNCIIVAFCLHRVDSGFLAGTDSLIDFQQVFWRFFIFQLELVDTNDRTGTRLTSICHL